MKGLKWGLLIGSVIMTLAIGPQPYWSENPPPFLAFLAGNLIAWVFLFYGMPIIAGIIAGVITRGSRRKNVLA